MASSPEGRGAADPEEYEGDGHHGEDGEGEGGKDGGAKDQERFLPVANISRIMKKGLPHNAKIAKDAKETMQECVSEFISFITSEASDKCQREKRKTINGDDLLWAMGTLGFEDYLEPLRVYLQRFRESEGDKLVRPSSTEGGLLREAPLGGGPPLTPLQMSQPTSFGEGMGQYGQQMQGRGPPS